VSEDARALLRGAAWMLPATVLGNAALFALDLYTNHVLGNAEYGAFVAYKRVLQFLGFVVLLGAENEVIRLVARIDRSGVPAEEAADAEACVGAARRWTQVAALSVGLALVGTSLVAGEWLRLTTNAAVAGALALVASARRMIGVAQAQGAGDLRPRALAMFAAWPAVQLYLVWLWCREQGLGADGAVLAYAAAMVVGSWIGPRRRPGAKSVASFAVLLSGSWPAWVQGMLMAAYTWIDHVLLAGLRGAEAAGIYGPVAALTPLFGLGLQALSSVGAPMIARQHAAGDSAALSRDFRRVARVSVLVAAPALAVCAAAPMAVLDAWSGGSPEAAPALRLMVAAQLFATSVGSVNYFLLMTGRQRSVLWNGVPALVANLALSFALIPGLGVTGAALANAAAMLLANGVALVQVRRAGGPWPLDLSMGKVVLAVAAGTLACWTCMAPAAAAASAVSLPLAARALELACLGSAAALGTGAALLVLGVEPEDRELAALVLGKLRRRGP
jgi:O-antigen/teichoic acid export membrane protein